VERPHRAVEAVRWRMLHPTRRELGVVAAVGVMVAGVTAVTLWSSPSEPVAVPLALSAVTTPSPTASAEAEEVVVAVAGKVRRPGLLRLPAGSRVADAVTAAGGLAPGAAAGLLNLARRVTDGELIAVGLPENVEEGASAGGTPSGSGKVNLNLATAAQFEALPGIGAVLAQRIVAFRQRHGPFRSVEGLREVDGIGARKFEDLRDAVTL
jgi:competence protein ComEA